MALAYLAYIVGEHYVHVSGVVAVVVAALTLGGIGRTRFTPTTWHRLEHTWQQLGFWANSLIPAMLVPRLIQTVSWEDMLMLAVLTLSTLVARSIVVFGLMPLLGMARLAESIGTAYGAVIVWGGLRGAVSLALGLAVADNQGLPEQFRHIVAVLTTGFVLFTLLVNGISLRPLVKLLGLDKLPPAEQALRDRALNLALARIKDKVSEVAAADQLAPQPVAAAMEEYDRRIAEAKADPEMAKSPSTTGLVAVGLRIMANREGELALDKLEAGILPRSIADSLIQVRAGSATPPRSAGLPATSRRPRPPSDSASSSASRAGCTSISASSACWPPSSPSASSVLAARAHDADRPRQVRRPSPGAGAGGRDRRHHA